MNKILLISGIGCAGIFGFARFHGQAMRARTTALAMAQQRASYTTPLEEARVRLEGLRAQVQEKQSRLSEARLHHAVSAELVGLLEGAALRRPGAALAELREQLGIGWDRSSDYVLVSKRVLGLLDFPRLDNGKGAADTTCQVLGLVSEEQAALATVLQRARDSWQAPDLERTEPHDDIVAQYAVRAPDADAEQSLSNHLAEAIVGAVGAERTELLLPAAWREFRRSLGPVEAETLTVRRSADADLVWETQQGSQSTKGAVRYAYYPSSWFLTAFPGGWKALAEKEGFELPAKFRSAP